MTTSRTTICSPAEVLAALGKASTASDDDRGMVEVILPLTDAAIKTFLGWEVIQNTYTHLLPDCDLFDITSYNSAWDLGEPFDAINGRISYAYPGMPQILQVPEIPLRSVTSLYADYSSAGGQGPVDFPAGSLLKQGTDYYIDFDAPANGAVIPYTTGVCWTGHIRRWLGGVWPARQRSALVTYVAGITPDELDSKTAFPSRRVQDIKLAAMLTAMAQFREFKAWSDRSGGQEAGPIISERLADYQAQYSEAAVLNATGLMTNIPFKAELLLRPHARIKR